MQPSHACPRNSFSPCGPISESVNKAHHVCTAWMAYPYAIAAEPVTVKTQIQLS